MRRLLAIALGLTLTLGSHASAEPVAATPSVAPAPAQTTLSQLLHRALNEHPNLVRLHSLTQLNLTPEVSIYEARERNEVALKVSTCYYRALQCDRKVQIGQDVQKSWEALLVVARKRLSDGMCPQMEVDALEADVANAKAGQILVDCDRTVAYEELATAMGVDDVPSQLAAESAETATLRSVSQDVSLAVAHPELVPVNLQTVGAESTHHAVEAYSDRVQHEQNTFFFIPVGRRQLAPQQTAPFVEATAAEHKELAQEVRFRITRDHQRIDALSAVEEIVNRQCSNEKGIYERYVARYSAGLANLSDVSMALNQWVESLQQQSRVQLDMNVARITLRYDTFTLVPVEPQRNAF